MFRNTLNMFDRYKCGGDKFLYFTLHKPTPKATLLNYSPLLRMSEYSRVTTWIHVSNSCIHVATEIIRGDSYCYMDIMDTRVKGESKSSDP